MKETSKAADVFTLTGGAVSLSEVRQRQQEESRQSKLRKKV